MRGIGFGVALWVLCGNAVTAQVTVKLTVPHTVVETMSDAALRQRIQKIIGREVRFRHEYELFIKDLVALGRRAVPHILEMVGDDVADRYVTEALLRVGGPRVLKWVQDVLADGDPNWREAFLTGVPAVSKVHPSVRAELGQFVHDKSHTVRIAAVRKFHTLVPAREVLTRCRDIHRDVVRVAVETVSQRWLFLDHRGKELENLEYFLGILEMHVRDDRWLVGRGFTKAFYKDRIASTRKGEELFNRAKKLPWFTKRVDGLSASELQGFRAKLGKKDAVVQEVLTKTLRALSPAAGADLLLVLAEDESVAVRLAACNAGLMLLDPDLAAAFVRFLKDPAPEIRARAKELLQQTSYYADQRERWGEAKRL